MAERIVSWAGEVDYARRTELASELAQVLTLPHLIRVVIDVAGVTFMDVAGLTVFVEARTIAAQSNINLVLANPSATIRRLFWAAGIGLTTA